MFSKRSSSELATNQPDESDPIETSPHKKTKTAVSHEENPWIPLSHLSFGEDKSLSTENEKIYKVFSSQSHHMSIEKLTASVEKIGLGKNYFDMAFDGVKDYPTLTEAKKIELQEYIYVAALFNSGTRICAKPVIKIQQGNQETYRLYVFYNTSVRSSVSSHIAHYFTTSQGFFKKNKHHEPYIEFNAGKYIEWVAAVDRTDESVAPALSPNEFIELINRRIHLIKPEFTIPEHVTNLLSTTSASAENPASIVQPSTSSIQTSPSRLLSTTLLTKQLASSPSLSEVIGELEFFLNKAKEEQSKAEEALSDLDRKKAKIAEEEKWLESAKEKFQAAQRNFSLMKTQFDEKHEKLKKFEGCLFEIIKLATELNPELGPQLVMQITSSSHRTDNIGLSSSTNTNDFFEDQPYLGLPYSYHP